MVREHGYNTGTVGLMALGYGALEPRAPPGTFADIHTFLEAAGPAARGG